MRHIIILSLSLALFWLVNSGHYSPLMLSFGLISIILAVSIAHKMDVVDHEAQPIHLTTRLPAYFLWLTREIVASNLLVVKHIWLGNHSISPTFATITASQRTDMGKVIYANSITLTPGTVTVEMKDDKFLVHALLETSIKDLEAGEMDRRVSGVE
ncbi:MAG: Na+/H+ antiporter subunit E [Chromatiales bacterium]|nr:Na+/H+ antiporter subunit E [Chromatiales bacterium]